MGMYDHVKVYCPFCKYGYIAQSYGGECSGEWFTLDNVPSDVLEDINANAPFTCERITCKTQFHVDIPSKTTTLWQERPITASRVTAEQCKEFCIKSLETYKQLPRFPKGQEVVETKPATTEMFLEMTHLFFPPK